MKKMILYFDFDSIKCFLIISAFFLTSLLIGQTGGVAITDDGSDPDPSAMLEVKSASKGMLIPRLNFLQMNGINPAANGLLIFNTDLKSFWFYDGTVSQWKELLKTGQESKWLGTGDIYYAGGNVGIGPASSPLSELTIHGGTGTNNAALTFDVDGTDWYVGIDDTDGDKLKIGTGYVVGSDPRMTVQSNGNVGIGTSSPESTLEVDGTMKVFGAWDSRLEGTVYLAETDGFVVAGLRVVSPLVPTHIFATGFTDGNTTPVTERGYVCIRQETYGDNLMSSFTMPVRKGDYWRVVATYYYGNFSSFIYWIPLGVND
jgi:hypothetical protein